MIENLSHLREVYIERQMRNGMSRSEAIAELDRPLTEEEKQYLEKIKAKQEERQKA